jgi:hypothetical protein
MKILLVLVVEVAEVSVLAQELLEELAQVLVVMQT